MAPPLPPKPRTESEIRAASVDTIPAPKDPRVEPGTEPTLREVLRSEAPPPNWREFADRLQRALGVVSTHDVEQDTRITTTQDELAALTKRVESIGSTTTASAETIGGKAAVVAREEQRKTHDVPKDESAPSPTVFSKLDAIAKANGKMRILLVLGALFEGIRWFAPLVSDLLRGLGK